MLVWGEFILVCFLSVRAIAESEPCGTTSASVINRRIIDGDETSPHQYPWMVSIQHDGVHGCGGSLISQSYVLTAAHCVSPPDDVTVVLGAYDWKNGEVSIQGSVVRHPLYIDVYSFDEYDVALIRLHSEAPVQSSIRPICLPTSDDHVEIGDEVFAIGWGSTLPSWDISSREAEPDTQRASKDPSDHELMQLEHRIKDVFWCIEQINAYNEDITAACERGDVDLAICQKIPQHPPNGTSPRKEHRYISDTFSMICALSHEESSVCYGDSGGPLMKQRTDGSWVVVGIVSIGARGCVPYLKSHPQTGVVFTNVLKMRPWIDFTMKRLERRHRAGQ